MRVWITIVLFFTYGVASAQDKSLEEAIAKLNTALVQKDTVTLKNILHDKVSYGHSNGWVESKADVVADLYNGKLVYEKIEQDITEVAEEGNIACVRVNAELDIIYNGNPLQLKLHVLQVWTKNNNKWMLLSRQSAKL